MLPLQPAATRTVPTRRAPIRRGLRSEEATWALYIITKLTTSDPPPLDPRSEKNFRGVLKKIEKIMRVALSSPSAHEHEATSSADGFCNCAML